MSDNVFKDKDFQPSEEAIKRMLGSNYMNLTAIKEIVFNLVGETTEEWKYYGAKYGWTLKTFLKKRNLFFIAIYDGWFNIAFVFGDRAVEAIENSGISPDLKEELMNSKKYAEGRGLRIKVEDDTYLDDIRELIQTKVNN